MAQITDTLEIEKEDDSSDEVLVKYDITSYPSDFTLDGLLKMWEEEDITIPDFQREFVWSIKQSSLLIESFLIGLPVPPVFFYIDDDNKNLVIDGQQRLLSIFYFLEGYFGKENDKGKRQTFRLTGLNKLNPYHNKRFADLDEKDKRKLKTSVLRAINIKQLTPSDESTSIYHIFERLNTGGTPLKPQEIRNCVFRGDFLGVLKNLNEDKNWRKILGKKLPDKHQTDVELILRVFGLCFHMTEYEKPMKEFLSKVSRKYQNTTTGRVARFKKDFSKTCDVIVNELGPRPFSVRGPLNTSIFDSVFCTILNNLNKLPKDLSKNYTKLIGDEDFLLLTTLGTTDAKVLKARFELVEYILISK